MNVTRRCDYACRILRAMHRSGTDHISVAEIAKMEDIPYAFARSIQHDLTKGGLVKTLRGAQGGLMFDCELDKVTLFDLIELIQGPVSVAVCATDPEYCSKMNHCSFHMVWHGANKLLDNYFSSITLADLLESDEISPVVTEALNSVPKK